MRGMSLGDIWAPRRSGYGGDSGCQIVGFNSTSMQLLMSEPDGLFSLANDAHMPHHGHPVLDIYSGRPSPHRAGRSSEMTAPSKSSDLPRRTVRHGSAPVFTRTLTWSAGVHDMTSRPNLHTPSILRHRFVLLSHVELFPVCATALNTSALRVRHSHPCEEDAQALTLAVRPFGGWGRLERVLRRWWAWDPCRRPERTASCRRVGNPRCRGCVGGGHDDVPARFRTLRRPLHPRPQPDRAPPAPPAPLAPPRPLPR